MSILNRCESRRGAQVIWLAVHSTEGNDTPRVDDAASLRDASWWEGSSHAICDNEALLTPAQGCVPYDLAAWTLRGGNRFSDNIEQVGWARWSRREWLDHEGTLDHTSFWLADRHRARSWIPLTKLSPREVGARKPGVIGHVDYTLGTGDGTHTDPGPNYPWDVVIDKARQYAAGTADTKEWWEMPVPAEDIEKIAQRTRQVIADGSLRYGLDTIQRRIVQLQTKQAAQDEVIRQLAENKGTPIDMAAVEAVVEKGVADAIKSIETTVRLEPGS